MARISAPVGLFLLFLLLLAAALMAQRPTPPRPIYDPGGNGPDGLLLLREWLGEMGYKTATTGTRTFATDQADLLFVYPGVEPFSSAEGDLLIGWVESGGTLVLVDTQDDELLERFDFSTVSGGSADQLLQSQPLLPEAAAAITGTHFARRLRLPDDSPAVTLLAEATPLARPAAALLRQGEGWVWLLGEDFTFTNERLTESRSSAQIVPALLRAVPTGGRLLFDTYHLFGPDRAEAGTGIDSLQEWAYTTPSGWASLFLILLGFGYLLLQGQRLGPPVQTITQGRRREAAEFVVAMAGLQRRAGVRESVARHQGHRLKQRLGRPWQLPADLPDAEFVARLAAADPLYDHTRLRGLLHALSVAPDEAALVALAKEADALVGFGSPTEPGLARNDEVAR